MRGDSYMMSGPARIETFLEENELAEMAHAYAKAGEDGRVVRLIRELEAERYDIGVLVRCVSEVYDEITFGMFSKPLTEPRYIIERVNELRDDDVAQAVKDTLEQVEDEG